MTQTPHGESSSLERTVARSQEINAELDKNPSDYRVLTGDRPTGHLHIGHYFGSLTNRVRLQNMGVDTIVLIADYQVITDREGVGPIKERVYSLVADYLAAGIDPDKSMIFLHSAVPALNQLMLPFLSLVTEAELKRNPTVKAELADSQMPMSGLMLTYPVHQAADILFCKANLVPVGKDQIPHIEMCRVIARRFDERYGRAHGDQPVFPQADALLTSGTLILGTDGTKMSKSKGNVIELRMTADETAKALKKAVTDSDRTITYDPVNRVEVSNLLDIAGLCLDRDPQSIAEEIGDGGAGQLKALVTEALNEQLREHRDRRETVMKDQGYLESIIRAGNTRANDIAEQTLTEVRTAMQMSY
jgi:tryptophanyl-tRNA synthetase